MRGTVTKKTITAALLALSAGALLLPFGAVRTHAEHIQINAEHTQINVAADPFGALEALSADYGFLSPREEFCLESISDVAYGKVYRFGQVYEGKEVSGRQVILAADEGGKLLFVNSNYLPIRSLPAAEVSKQQLPLGDAAEKQAEEVVYSLGGSPLPAFEVTEGFEQVYYSAVNGKELFRYPLSAGAMVATSQTNALGEEVELEITERSGSYFLYDDVRNIYAYNMRGGTLPDWKELYSSSTAAFSDDLAVSAYQTAVKAYDFYADASNIGVSRKGINGKSDDLAGNSTQNGEIPIWLLLHYSRDYQNANFTYDALSGAAQLIIGDGSLSGPLYRQAAAADVVAHEYQHAITQFTANLYYMNESGAINEAISDIMGSLIEGYSPSEEQFWTIGEHAVTADASHIRSAIVPEDDYRRNAQNKAPLCYLNHVHTNCDNGGVHSNSTILTHMQYNLWRKLPAFFTPQRIGTLWYSTLLALTSNADFAEFARQFRASAQALGYGEEVLQAIDESLFESGLVGAEDSHLVTFYNGYGNIVEEVCVHHGDAAPLPAPPEPILTIRYVYEFSGWEGQLDCITEDTVVRPRYSSVPRLYQVRFLDSEGNTVAEEEVPYGGSVTLPSPPERPSTPFYDYEFTGWSGGDPSNVQTDLFLTPLYRQIRCYTVTFLDEQGFTLCTARVREGEEAVAPLTPVKASTQEYSYPFLGWDRPTEEVHSDFSVRAVFGQELRRYTVTFLSGQKVLLKTTAPYGSLPTLPDLTGRTRSRGEQFTGWYSDAACTDEVSAPLPVTGDVSYYAGWEKTGAGCTGESAGSLLLWLLPLSALLFTAWRPSSEKGKPCRKRRK